MILKVLILLTLMYSKPIPTKYMRMKPGHFILDLLLDEKLTQIELYNETTNQTYLVNQEDIVLKEWSDSKCYYRIKIRVDKNSFIEEKWNINLLGTERRQLVQIYTVEFHKDSTVVKDIKMLFNLKEIVSYQLIYNIFKIFVIAKKSENEEVQNIRTGKALRDYLNSFEKMLGLKCRAEGLKSILGGLNKQERNLADELKKTIKKKNDLKEQIKKGKENKTTLNKEVEKVIEYEKSLLDEFKTEKGMLKKCKKKLKWILKVKPFECHKKYSKEAVNKRSRVRVIYRTVTKIVATEEEIDSIEEYLNIKFQDILNVMNSKKDNESDLERKSNDPEDNELVKRFDSSSFLSSNSSWEDINKEIPRKSSTERQSHPILLEDSNEGVPNSTFESSNESQEDIPSKEGGTTREVEITNSSPVIISGEESSVVKPEVFSSSKQGSTEPIEESDISDVGTHFSDQYCAEKETDEEMTKLEDFGYPKPYSKSFYVGCALVGVLGIIVLKKMLF